MFTRVAVLGTMCLVLYTLGAQLEQHSWALISIVALACVLEFLAYRRGVVEGMDMYRLMNTEQRARVDSILKDEEQ